MAGTPVAGPGPKGRGRDVVRYVSEEREMDNVAGIVLAGGPSSRMGGKPKCMMRINGKRIMPLLLKKFSHCFSEILIATRNPLPFLTMGVPLALDKVAFQSPLAGIHGGLTFCVAPHAFIAPCDVPFLKVELIRLLLERVTPEADVVVPVVDGHPMPLCAVYSKRCLPFIKEQLSRGDNKITDFFDKVNVVKVEEKDLTSVDPDLDSFFNLNTPADMRQAILKAKRRGI